MSNKNGRENGFTMVELMIVVAIIGIASIIAVPAINEWLARYQLNQAMSEITGDLNLAKLVAMNRNRQASVTIQASGALIEVSGVSGGQQIFPTRTLMPRVTTLPGGPATVNFSSMGLSTTAASQTIQIQNERGLIYTLLVLPSGKVSWCAKTSCS
ncbi:MAG: prepilin-type N-terminal cleavage/methylation domain-containing protein [Nitrospira sp.]|nr:prepilin-type N-terminal cleavage/methylation domain-containing protein [Nitrospira sp.]